MLVKLIGKEILNNTYSEEELSELSVMEFVYALRSFKAVIDADGDFIEVQEKDNGCVYSEKYKIGFNKTEYIKK